MTIVPVSECDCCIIVLYCVLTIIPHRNPGPVARTIERLRSCDFG